MRRIIIDPLSAILEAREYRAFLKKQISDKGLASLSLSLNVPGFPKSNSTVNLFFSNCLNEFKYALKSFQIGLVETESVGFCDAAGNFFLVPCSDGVASLKDIKQVCEDFELSHPLGRFIDADVNDEHGVTVSSGKSKLCFFCLERPAIDCRREMAHEYEELRAFMFPKMAEYNRQQYEAATTKKLAALALQAILSEISLTPKPGLVDKMSNGSHSDMDYQTFIRSTAAIAPWFEVLISEGFLFHDKDLAKALPIIRSIGLRMESAMYEATGGINTQKGIIFLMGLSLFACGKLLGRNNHFDSDEFRETVGAICKDITQNELVAGAEFTKSHGENMFKKYGFAGARGEAEGGFPMVFDHGLPQLLKSEHLTHETMINALLAIAANNTDTNILHRGGPEVLNHFKHLSMKSLLDFNDQNYHDLMTYCLQQNISPGGSADLLAVTIFVWSVLKAF